MFEAERPFCEGSMHRLNSGTRRLRDRNEATYRHGLRSSSVESQDSLRRLTSRQSRIFLPASAPARYTKILMLQVPPESHSFRYREGISGSCNRSLAQHDRDRLAGFLRFDSHDALAVVLDSDSARIAVDSDLDAARVHLIRVVADLDRVSGCGTSRDGADVLVRVGFVVLELVDDAARLLVASELQVRGETVCEVDKSKDRRKKQKVSFGAPRVRCSQGWYCNARTILEEGTYACRRHRERDRRRAESRWPRRWQASRGCCR